MKEITFYSSLIRSIEQIYFRFALIVLHKRMDGYHKQASQSIKPYANDIKSPLIECIDEIIENDQGNPEDLDSINYSILTSSITYLHGPAKHNTVERHVINKENVGELSKHFKARSNGAALHPGIKEKLEHSTWEHIHAAIRHARKGDNSNAKIHTDIASSACKELAHFMEEEHYLEFIMEIEKHFDAIKQNTKSETIQQGQT